MTSFNIDSKGSIKKASRRLKRQASSMKVVSPVMKKISIFLDGWVQRNFKTQGSNVGGWDKLKLGGRRRKGGGFDNNAKILQDTGRLKASFKPFSTKANAGIGSNLPYSKIHEKGLNGMKKRRMLPNKSDREVSLVVNKLLGGHVKKVFKK